MSTKDQVIGFLHGGVYRKLEQEEQIILTPWRKGVVEQEQYFAYDGRFEDTLTD